MKNQYVSVQSSIDLLDDREGNLIEFSRQIKAIEHHRQDLFKKQSHSSEEGLFDIDVIIDFIRMREIKFTSLSESLKAYYDCITKETIDFTRYEIIKNKLKSCIGRRWENKNRSPRQEQLILRFSNKNEYESFILFLKHSIRDIEANLKRFNTTETSLQGVIFENDFRKFYYSLRNRMNFFGIFSISSTINTITKAIHVLRDHTSEEVESIQELIRLHLLWTDEQLRTMLHLYDRRELPLSLDHHIIEPDSFHELYLKIIKTQRKRVLHDDIYDFNLSTTTLSKIESDNFIKDLEYLTGLSHVFKHAITIVEHSDIDHIEIQKMKDNCLALEELSEKLQNRAMTIRNIEIGIIFPYLSKLALELSNDLRKKTVIEFYGSEVNIEKSILTSLNESMHHLITNCIEHGVETPLVREKMKKEITAKIIIQAKEHDNKITLDIIDDGVGLPIESMTKKAIERKLIVAKGIQDPCEDDLIDLLFSCDDQCEHNERSGISNVKNLIHTVGGTVSFSSSENKGTQVSIHIPKCENLRTRSILLTIVGHQYFGISMKNIEYLSILDSDHELPMLENGVEVFPYRNKSLPIIVLQDLFGLELPENNTNLINERCFVILKVDQLHYAVEVTKLDEFGLQVPQDLLHGHFDDGPFDGASVMGNGSLCLMISLDKILYRYKVDHKKNNKTESIIVQGNNHSNDNNLKNTLIFKPFDSNIMLSIDMLSIHRIDSFSIESLTTVKRKRIYRSKLGYLQYFDFSDFKIGDTIENCMEPKSVLIINISDRPIAIGIYDIIDMYYGELTYHKLLNVCGIQQSWTYKGDLVGVVDLNHMRAFF